jgi:hypothetical protein
MKNTIRKIIREFVDEPPVMYFLRWTDSPESDIKRNFSGHMQAWFDSEEEAWDDYIERGEQGNKPKEDEETGMWNSDPEWGLSGYGFKDEESFNRAMKKIKDIAWYHKEDRNQDLVVFESSNYRLGMGFDGEDLFRDVTKFWYIDMDMDYKEINKN